MRRYVTTNYYSVRCNCGPFISPAVALSAIYTLARFYRSTILREGHYSVLLCVFEITFYCELIGETIARSLKYLLVRRSVESKCNSAQPTKRTVQLGVKNTPADLDHVMQNTTCILENFTILFTKQRIGQGNNGNQ